jgi:hypothetical protein
MAIAVSNRRQRVQVVSKMRIAIEIRTSALGACQRDVLPGQRVFLGAEPSIVDAFGVSR